MAKNPKKINTIVYEAAKDFITSHYPDEFPFFEQIWQRFLEQKDNAIESILAHGHLPRGYSLSGLPFAEAAKIRLATPAVFMSLWLMLEKLESEVSLLDVKQIQKGIDAFARAAGASKALAKEIARDAAQGIYGAQQGTAAAGQKRKSTAQETRIDEDHVYVEWVQDGRHGAEYCSADHANVILSEHPYDIIIDEVNDCLIVQGRPIARKPDGPHEIFRISARLRGMLWLILTHWGTQLEHKRISELFGLEKDLTYAKDRAQRIHQYKLRLGGKSILGAELVNRIIGKGDNRAYSISKREWSFCWIRAEADPNKTKLLIGV